MSETLYIIIGVLLFAVATAALYVIGLRKKVNEDERLMQMLLNNGAYRVTKYLKSHDYVTADGIGHLVKLVNAKEFYSKKKAVVTDGSQFQNQVIDFMLRRNYITLDTDKNGETIYRLPSKEGERK